MSNKQPDICYSTNCPMYSKLLPNGCGIGWQDEHIPMAARCEDFTSLESCTVSQMVKGAV